MSTSNAHLLGQIAVKEGDRTVRKSIPSTDPVTDEAFRKTIGEDKEKLN